ncbi:acetone carboxylase subunit gamma [Halovivax gelatinilyticus]|uniref:acetone carboxylase subunit gamma n=1 Tax=Halovivax gelatinilyticus TaxID=2961597 RepID=UPI0020CA47D9|nr:acetone carboxylase subunit gamma [Halovivax gelatinilyticus]
MRNRRVDTHLEIDTDQGVVRCRKCRQVLCDADENYKYHLLCDRSPLQEAGPLVNDPSLYVDDDFEFRRYYCPNCAVQVETEVILADLPPIHDKEVYADSNAASEQ